MRREEDGAPLGGRLAHELLERPLHERIEPDDGSSSTKLGAADERLHEADLLLVAARERPDRTLEVELEPRRQLARVGVVEAAAQRAEVREQLGAGQSLVERELARQVADSSSDLHRRVAHRRRAP